MSYHSYTPPAPPAPPVYTPPAPPVYTPPVNTPPASPVYTPPVNTPPASPVYTPPAALPTAFAPVPTVVSTQLYVPIAGSANAAVLASVRTAPLQKSRRQGSGAPITWITPAGILGTYAENTQIVINLEVDNPLTTPVVYSLLSGSLPTGLVLSTTGNLSGLPQVDTIGSKVAREFRFVVRVTNTVGRLADRTFSLFINQIIPPVLLPTGVRGEGISSSFGNINLTFANRGLGYFSANVKATITSSNIAGAQLALPGQVYLFANGAVKNIALTKPGTGYITTPNISISGNNTIAANVSIAALTNNNTEDLGSYFDNDFVNIQILQQQISPTGILEWGVMQGQLPPGLRLNSSGTISGYPQTPPAAGPAGTASYDIGTYDQFVYDFEGASESRVYRFTVRIFDGISYAYQRYSINILAKTYFLIDNILISADSTLFTVDRDGYQYPSISTPAGSLPPVRQLQNYAFQFKAFYSNPAHKVRWTVNAGGPARFDQGAAPFPDDNNDVFVLVPFDGKSFDQSDLSLPGGLFIDLNTGWLLGTLGESTVYESTYTFTVQAYVEVPISTTVFSTRRSQAVTYTLTVLDDVIDLITWTTSSDLGSIDNGSVSTLQVQAQSRLNSALTYRVKSGQYVRIPQGLTVLSNGLISGRIGFDDVVADRANTTKTYNDVTKVFDTQYKFTVIAQNLDATTFAEKEFTITVSNVHAGPYENLYLKALLPDSLRRIFRSIVTDPALTSEDIIYRASDPYFGVNLDLTLLVQAGIKSELIQVYIDAMSMHHYNKQIDFGTIKKAVARNLDGSVKYEVLYVNVLDYNTNPAAGFQIINQDNSTVIDYGSVDAVTAATEDFFSVDDAVARVDDFGLITSLDYTVEETVVSNSFANMARDIADTIGYQFQGALPEWMLSVQPDTNQPLGLVRGLVLAYANPGQGNNLLYRYQSILQLSGLAVTDVMNTFRFVADRYQWDRALSVNFDPSQPSVDRTVNLAVTNASSGAYIIDGVANPSLTLIKGYTYNFVIDAVGHPFWIKSVASTGTINAYQTGVNNNGIQAGTVQFTVPLNAPDVLYYNCQFHTSMQGVLNITNSAVAYAGEFIASDKTTFDLIPSGGIVDQGQWLIQNSGVGVALNSVAYLPGYGYTAVGKGTTIVSSVDGTQWRSEGQSVAFDYNYGLLFNASAGSSNLSLPYDSRVSSGDEISRGDLFTTPARTFVANVQYNIRLSANAANTIAAGTTLQFVSWMDGAFIDASVLNTVAQGTKQVTLNSVVDIAQGYGVLVKAFDNNITTRVTSTVGTTQVILNTPTSNTIASGTNITFDDLTGNVVILATTAVTAAGANILLFANIGAVTANYYPRVTLLAADTTVQSVSMLVNVTQPILANISQGTELEFVHRITANAAAGTTQLSLSNTEQLAVGTEVFSSIGTADVTDVYWNLVSNIAFANVSTLDQLTLGNVFALTANSNVFVAQTSLSIIASVNSLQTLTVGQSITGNNIPAGAVVANISANSAIGLANVFVTFPSANVTATSNSSFTYTAVTSEIYVTALTNNINGTLYRGMRVLGPTLPDSALVSEIVYSADTANISVSFANAISIAGVPLESNIALAFFTTQTVSAGTTIIGKNNNTITISNPLLVDVTLGQDSVLGFRLTDVTLNKIRIVGTQYIAVGDRGLVATKQQGTDNWSQRFGLLYGDLKAVDGRVYTANNAVQTTYVAVGNEGTVITSLDGDTWSLPIITLANQTLNAVAYGDGAWIAVGDAGQIITSLDDGINWTLDDTVTNQNIKDVGYLDNKWIAVGNKGLVYLKSATADPWQTINSGITDTLRSVAYVNNSYVACGSNGLIITSIDGIKWVTYSKVTNNVLNAVSRDAPSPVIVGDAGVIITESLNITIDWAVANIAFENFNNQSLSSLAAQDYNVQHGDTLIFSQQEGFGGTNDGWNLYGSPYDIGQQSGFDTAGFDEFLVVPGFGSVNNQRAGLWQVNVSDSNVVTLEFLRQNYLGQIITVKSTSTKLFYNAVVQSGKTVPAYSILSEALDSDLVTTFDQLGTRFATSRDNYNQPGNLDKYIKFPKTGVIR